MKKTCLFALFTLASVLSSWGAEVVIKQYKYSGAFEIRKPFLGDSADVNNKKFAEKDLLKSSLSFDAVQNSGQTLSTNEAGELTLPGSGYPYALHLVSFNLQNDRYCKGKLVIEGAENTEIYLDRSLQTVTGGQLELALEPRRYEVIIKILGIKNEVPALKVTFRTESDAVVSCPQDNERPYILNDVMEGKRIQSASISPNGNYILVSYQETFPGGKGSSYTQLIDRTNGRLLMSREGDAARMRWTPKSNKTYYVRQGMEGRELVTIDPASAAETVLATNLPEGSFTLSPTEDCLFFTIQEKGPKERDDVQQILVPDDRQPGWRNRSFIHRYDLRTGLFERLTFGYLSTSIHDISADGRYLLFASRKQVLTERPFSRTSLYRMDLTTLQTDTILKEAKFVGRAQFSPDGQQLLISGSGESFDGIGKNVKPEQTPSTSDGQLFIYNLSDGEVTPLTKTFNPSVDNAEWNPFDKQIYLLAKERDCVRIYTIDPLKGSIRQLPSSEDVVSDISLASTAPVLIYYGMSASNSHRLYAQGLAKKKEETCLVDLSKDLLAAIQLGEVKDWNFVSSFGDTIYGRYYLPPHFDPNKKYPVIVNYYGGVTPTARVLESRYPSHAYAALGYIVYILHPSGATGFSQEFSARHVNAWGKQTGEEIIEGTLKFCEAHPFVNKDKIGCMGASYGGFMTMYLQTKADIFAAAMSHAGISDITGYWGEGYWGYSYNETAAANSYPWNAPDIYVGQSPLFSADKVNTPILFLHGAADTNVPISESIGMFTALKLLGKPTAFVQVEGENHHILDYDKRLRWNNTTFAWFAKWLKDQPEWWDALYPPKHL